MSGENADVKKKVVWFSFCGALLILAQLAVDNFLNTPYPWVLYCVPAVLLWPLTVWVAFSVKSRAGKTVFSWGAFAVLSAYYVALNILLPGNFPWSCIVAGALLWFPAAFTFAGKPKAFSVFGFAWAVVFFCVLNAVTSPHTIWAVYPIFGIFWWPLSVFFFIKKRPKQVANR